MAQVSRGFRIHYCLEQNQLMIRMTLKMKSIWLAELFLRKCDHFGINLTFLLATHSHFKLKISVSAMQKDT